METEERGPPQGKDPFCTWHSPHEVWTILEEIIQAKRLPADMDPNEVLFRSHRKFRKGRKTEDAELPEKALRAYLTAVVKTTVADILREEQRRRATEIALCEEILESYPTGRSTEPWRVAVINEQIGLGIIPKREDFFVWLRNVIAKRAASCWRSKLTEVINAFEAGYHNLPEIRKKLEIPIRTFERLLYRLRGMIIAELRAQVLTDSPYMNVSAFFLEVWRVAEDAS